ncbi:MAG: hypothetical protein EHM34_03455 [Nitrosopumilales archaeon]|nr:MAG: hypothetical protein EHM34_08825 [Nitrosopumilales archaeon]RPI84522.1 MAG: hypothetical protein EHM34_03455 [Nitrosopumilales archaeon]
MNRLDRLEKRLNILTEQVDSYGMAIRKLLEKNKLSFNTLDKNDPQSCDVCGHKHAEIPFCDTSEDEIKY